MSIYRYLSLSHWFAPLKYAWLVYGFHLYIVVVIKKAEPQDDNDEIEAMMNIINVGTQYGPNQNEADPEFDDGSQYLLNFEDEQELVQENPVQENAGEVYLLLILHLLYIWN